MDQGLVRQHAARHHCHAVDVMALRTLQNAIAVQAVDVPSNHFGIAFRNLLDALTPSFRRQLEVLGAEFRDH